MSDNAQMNEILRNAAGRGVQPVDRPRTEAGKFSTMNDLIRQGAGLGTTAGGSSEHAQQLKGAMAEYQAAMAAGDEVAAGVADQQIEQLLAEGREAQAPAGFDGGVMGRTSEPVPEQAEVVDRRRRTNPLSSTRVQTPNLAR